MSAEPFSKSTRAKMAACATLGLSYWADHPANGCMWAVDNRQQAHVVRWYRKKGQVALQRQGEPRKRMDYARGRFVDYVPTWDAGNRVEVA